MIAKNQLILPLHDDLFDLINDHFKLGRVDKAASLARCFHVAVDLALRKQWTCFRRERVENNSHWQIIPHCVFHQTP